LEEIFVKKLLIRALTLCMVLALLPVRAANAESTGGGAPPSPPSPPAADDIMAWAVTDGFTTTHGINMTQEAMELPDGYNVRMYRMLQPGKLKGDWIDATDRPLNNRNLSRLLNRGGALFITDGAFDRKGPGAGDTVIQFPHVNPRAKHLPYAVNYSFGASTSIDSLGTWTIAEVRNRTHVPAPRQLMAVKPTAGIKLTQEDLDAGRFRVFDPQPVAVTRAEARTNVWFVRENAIQHDNGTFTPSSRIRRFSGRPAGKAPEFKDKAIKEAAAGTLKLRHRKNWMYALNGNHEPTFSTGDGRTPITRSGTYVFWVAPTPVKPPSIRSAPVIVG
jgi:hypothetical protein